MSGVALSIPINEIFFNSMKKIVTILGARPQFIKASTVSKALAARRLHEVLIHTGQHFDVNMSDVFFDDLEIPLPKYHLGIGGGSHGQNTGRMIEAVERVLIEEKPDWVLVYGDTDSTLAGTLAAVKCRFPVAHVEAGLRSFNKRMPEEINRVLTDHASRMLFAPTYDAVQNLAAEGIGDERVRLVGDVMYDAALFYGAKADAQSDVLTRIGLSKQEYVLSTVHRAENTDDIHRLAAILEGFALLDRQVVLPLHPRTRKCMALNGLKLSANVLAVDPVGYLDMVMLEKSAALIATDSGGVQKEAFFYRVPCVTLRDETEWVELVEAGWNRLASPSDAENILGTMNAALGSIGEDVQPYGDGGAAVRIADILAQAPVS
jgi:UDP-GlcNAc3NAcA epimerase